jgi:hypothetical protein
LCAEDEAILRENPLFNKHGAARPNLNAETGAKSVDATRFPPRGIHACHVPRKSGVLTIERRVIMAISSTKHQAHPERLGTSTEQ